MTRHYKTKSMAPNDFGHSLNLINAAAIVMIEERGIYGTDTHELFCDWDDDQGAFPTDDEMNAAVAIANWDNMRKERDSLLAATDFYALSDVTMPAEMATYREALRDLPASTAKSEDVVWPTKP
jgi:hypothetical protein